MLLVIIVVCLDILDMVTSIGLMGPYSRQSHAKICDRYHIR